MPLSKRQFELGIDEEGEQYMRQIYRLLADNRELAYSFDELESGAIGAASTQPSKFIRAVEVLAEIGAMDVREVDLIDYYAFRQEFDAGTWYSAKHTISSL